MFTPSDILDKQFKTGLGYDKKDVEQFLHDLSSEFVALQQDNNALRAKIKELNDSLTYYKSIEKTLQKALILAEKTAQDTRATAIKEAEAIEQEAKLKASRILNDTRNQIELYEHKTLNLMQQYDLFKIHFENLLHAQLELLNSKSFAINTDEFTYKDSSMKEQKEADSESEQELQKALKAITEDAAAALQAQEEKSQLSFDFLNENTGEESYHTEDGFEFFTMDQTP